METNFYRSWAEVSRPIFHRWGNNSYDRNSDAFRLSREFSPFFNHKSTDSNNHDEFSKVRKFVNCSTKMDSRFTDAPNSKNRSGRKGRRRNRKKGGKSEEFPNQVESSNESYRMNDFRYQNINHYINYNNFDHSENEKINLLTKIPVANLVTSDMYFGPRGKEHLEYWKNGCKGWSKDGQANSNYKYFTKFEYEKYQDNLSGDAIFSKRLT